MSTRLGAGLLHLALFLAASGLPGLAGPARPLQVGPDAAHASPLPAALNDALPERPVRGRVSDSEGSSSLTGAGIRWCPDGLPAWSEAPELVLARSQPIPAPAAGPGVRHPGPAAPARAPPFSAR